MLVKYNLIFIFIFIIFLSGCGSDTTTTITYTPTPTRTVTPTSTPVPVTPTVTPTLQPTSTPTPDPNTNLTDQFNLLSAVFTYNSSVVKGEEKKFTAKNGYSGGTLTIQLRQINTSTKNITDFEIKAADNPGLQFYNTTVAGGPEKWIASNGEGVFSWQGEQPLTPGTTFNFYIYYSNETVVFPSKIHVIVTGGTNHAAIGYVDIPVLAPPVPTAIPLGK